MKEGRQEDAFLPDFIKLDTHVVHVMKEGRQEDAFLPILSS
jgi:hypothetical protein